MMGDTSRIFPENADLLSSLGVLYMKSGKDTLSFSRLSSALAFDSKHSKAVVATASMMQVSGYKNTKSKK
jgi:hypothetical protein